MRLIYQRRKVGNVSFQTETAGSLQRLYIGQNVELNAGETALSANAKKPNGTAIDEVAVFDYPATVEQLKWLAKFKPAQPANGPAREMPYCWHLDTSDDMFGATAKVNSGTGTREAFFWGAEDETNPGVNTKNSVWPYMAEPTEDAALGTSGAMREDGQATWRVACEDTASGADGGLGPTVGSGFTISFWMRAKEKPGQWSDFFTFCVGGRTTGRFLRYEFRNNEGDNLAVYGGGGTGMVGPYTQKINTWQHYCAVWNNATKEIDFYVDGSPMGSGSYYVESNPAHAVTEILAGHQSYTYENGKLKAKSTYTGKDNVYIDEVALFNHSFSPEQVQWLAQNVPCLPALDATNLVRVVSANASWSGGLASWGVREWDAETAAWTTTDRTTIYPALEDTEVDVEVTLADGVVLTNDTFVTPKSLVFKAESGASATLDCADDSMFDPAVFELGEGVNLSVAAGAIAMKTGTVKFNEGSSIKLDCSGIEKEWTEVLSASGITLPEGSGTVLDHVKAQRGSYTFMVDGNRILCKKVYGLKIIFR